MRKKFKDPLVFAVFLAVFMFSCIVIVYEHEEAHHAIYRQFGVDSNISFSFVAGQTQADALDTAKLSESDARVLRALQSANEVYGYQIFALVAMSTVYSIIIIVLILNTNNRGENVEARK